MKNRISHYTIRKDGKPLRVETSGGMKGLLVESEEGGATVFPLADCDDPEERRREVRMVRARISKYVRKTAKTIREVQSSWFHDQPIAKRLGPDKKFVVESHNIQKQPSTGA